MSNPDQPTKRVWKQIFRFSLAESLVGMLVMAGMFFLNSLGTDYVFSVSPHQPGKNWHWVYTEGFPFEMRGNYSPVTREELNIGILGTYEFHQVNREEVVVKKGSIYKLNRPTSFEIKEVFVSGIVYNLLIDLAVLFALHLLFVIYWRERQKEKPIHAP